MDEQAKEDKIQKEESTVEGNSSRNIKDLIQKDVIEKGDSSEEGDTSRTMDDHIDDDKLQKEESTAGENSSRKINVLTQQQQDLIQQEDSSEEGSSSSNINIEKYDENIQKQESSESSGTSTTTDDDTDVIIIRKEDFSEPGCSSRTVKKETTRVRMLLHDASSEFSEMSDLYSSEDHVDYDASSESTGSETSFKEKISKKNADWKRRNQHPESSSEEKKDQCTSPEYSSNHDQDSEEERNSVSERSGSSTELIGTTDEDDSTYVPSSESTDSETVTEASLAESDLIEISSGLDENLSERSNDSFNGEERNSGSERLGSSSESRGTANEERHSGSEKSHGSSGCSGLLASSDEDDRTYVPSGSTTSETISEEFAEENYLIELSSEPECNFPGMSDNSVHKKIPNQRNYPLEQQEQKVYIISSDEEPAEKRVPLQTSKIPETIILSGDSTSGSDWENVPSVPEDNSTGETNKSDNEKELAEKAQNPPKRDQDDEENSQKTGDEDYQTEQGPPPNLEDEDSGEESEEPISKKPKFEDQPAA